MNIKKRLLLTVSYCFGSSIGDISVHLGNIEFQYYHLFVEENENTFLGGE